MHTLESSRIRGRSSSAIAQSPQRTIDDAGLDYPLFVRKRPEAGAGTVNAREVDLSSLLLNGLHDVASTFLANRHFDTRFDAERFRQPDGDRVAGPEGLGL